METTLSGKHQHTCPQCFAHPDHETDGPCEYPEPTLCAWCAPTPGAPLAAPTVDTTIQCAECGMVGHLWKDCPMPACGRVWLAYYSVGGAKCAMLTDDRDCIPPDATEVAIYGSSSTARLLKYGARGMEALGYLVTVDTSVLHYEAPDPDPQTPAAREAAQRADEAELAAMSEDEHNEDDEVCPPCWAGVHTECHGCPCRHRFHYGAPSHYTDPAWHADEAWALQEERNAASAQEAATVIPGPGGTFHWTPDTEVIQFTATTMTTPPAPHTHPCPTCRQARSCTGTGCADGPRECATCSNCRGW